MDLYKIEVSWYRKVRLTITTIVLKRRGADGQQWYVCVGQRIGDTVLFFGCRKKTEDFLYEEELYDYKEKGTLADLHVAFSRDQVWWYHRQWFISACMYHITILSMECWGACLATVQL